ncbi:ABC transporter permease [Spongiimicrobium salis]|uniref:ABC transporter permease n=1 Tax=Spongiimicrobium salis TaxID=1667022 RepID=UPI00374DAE88
MLKNHLKMSFRNLWKNRLLSALNLLGLSIGIGSVLTLIFAIYAYYSADDSLQDQENIVYLRTETREGAIYSETPYLLLDEILKSSPDVVAGSHLQGWLDPWLTYKDVELQEYTSYVDPEFFEVFSMPLKYGDSKTALQEKYAVILTEPVSQRIFGDTNPVGETLMANDTLSLTVTGVLEPISPYSAFRLKVVMSTELLEEYPGFEQTADWQNSSTMNYLRLRPGADRAQLERQIDDIVQKNYTNPSSIAAVRIEPFENVRTNSIPVVEIIIGGAIAASIFVLLIVMVNLLNLNTSTMFRRTKDIAVRKILGGSKKSVIFQFCIENAILVCISILISAVIFLSFLLPRLNEVFGSDFGEISFTLQNDYPVVLYAIGIGVLVTLVVGILPTLRFISIPVVLGIKGKMETIKKSFLLRNSFIILQFTIAILFICVAVILNHQIGFMKDAPLGFTKENIIVGNIDLEYKNEEKAISKFGVLLNKLEANPYVEHFSASEAVPSDYYSNYTRFYEPNLDREIRTRYSRADDGYLKTMEIPLILGRDFDKNIDRAENLPVIINETTMKLLGWTSIDGKRLQSKGVEGAGYPVVGVMKDFHFQDMQEAVEPLVHFYRGEKALLRHRFLSVRVVPGHEKEIQEMIAQDFGNISTRRLFESNYLTDKVSAQYSLIDGILKTVNVVALLTIFISCLGMFGLISFMAKRRIKEIGVRKVLGAGVLKIVVLLSKDYIILVSIASAIAFPIAGYVMNAWLADFAYSIQLQWWMFALSGFIALIITSLTLSIQAIKSASVNPIKSLRTE